MAEVTFLHRILSGLGIGKDHANELQDICCWVWNNGSVSCLVKGGSCFGRWGIALREMW